MRQDAIIHSLGLKECMREQVQVALTKQEIVTSEMAEFYLVNLLCEFHTHSTLFEKSGEVDKPFAILLMEAFASDASVRTARLKALGDKSLIVAGFFADNIRRRLVDLAYYKSIRGQAYGSLASMLENRSSFSDLYAELARKFEDFAEVLAIVAPWNRPMSNADLVRIYRRWLDTGDEKLEGLLKQQGITTEEDE